MGVIDNIDKVISALDGLTEEVNSIISYNADELLQLRKDEILLGRNSEGEPFTPTYRNDTYFKSPQSAGRYAEYKYRLEILHNSRIEHVLPYPNKDRDTPNLRLTQDTYSPGRNFQDSMYINVSGDSFIINSTYKDSNSINLKYIGRVYEPAWGAKMVFWNEIMFPALVTYFERKIA